MEKPNFYDETLVEPTESNGFWSNFVSFLTRGFHTNDDKFRNAAIQNRKFPEEELDSILPSFSVVESEYKFTQFLQKNAPSGFDLNQEALKTGFKLSAAVIKMSLEVKDGVGTPRTYIGTGTIFSVESEVVIFTNKHVLTPQDGTTLHRILATIDGETIDCTLWQRRYHATLDVAKITVPSDCKKLRAQAFPFPKPKFYEVDRLAQFLQLFPTKETNEDTGYLFFVVGFPLGLEKRVSVKAVCKRIGIERENVYTHSAPTFGGSSGSILFAVPMGKGEDGKAQVKALSELVVPQLNSIAGIHYKRTDNNSLNSFVNLMEMFEF